MDSDFLKGINKAIDAAEGRTGTEYQYKYHTDTTEALDRLAAAISEGGGASSIADLTDVDISGTPQGGSVLKYNAVEGKWTPGDDAGNVQSDWDETNPASGAYILHKPTVPAVPTILTGTLPAGRTSITFIDNSITANALISIYTSADEWYISRSISETTLTITFDEQASDMAVTVEVK